MSCLNCGSEENLERRNWGAEYCAVCIEHTFEPCGWCKEPWPPDVLDYSPHGSFCPPC